MDLFFFDVVLKIPYPIGDKNGRKDIPFKIPAPNYHYALFYLELLGIELRTLLELRKYEVKKVEGKSRVTYTNLRLIKETELSTIVAVYRRSYKPKIRHSICQGGEVIPPTKLQ